MNANAAAAQQKIDQLNEEIERDKAAGKPTEVAEWLKRKLIEEYLRDNLTHVPEQKTQCADPSKCVNKPEKNKVCKVCGHKGPQL